jgi:multiple sugar transport system permease protein
MTAAVAPRSVVRRRSGRRVGNALRTIGTVAGLAVVAVWCLFPAYWMVISSLKGPHDVFNNSLIPTSPTFANYVTIFTAPNEFGLAMRNSLIVAALTTLIALVVGTTAAYALARFHFRLKPIVMIAILCASMFPAIALLTPLFQLFSSWRWINQFQALIIPDISFSLPLAVWILNTFFQQMPWELEEAALIDGCTDGQAFRRIVLPLAAPGVFTAAILVFIGAWNEYLIAGAMSINIDVQPVTVAIAKFAGVSEYEQPFGPQMAAGVVATLPLVILVLVFQRRIVSGLTAGGIK